MKKSMIFRYLLPVFFAGACIFVACNKEKVLPNKEQITEIQEKILGIPDDPTDENFENGNVTLSKSATPDCNPLFSQITMSNGMLVFTDWNHFESVLRCLENQVDAYNDAFEAQYGYMSDEEFNATAERLGFIEDQPLIDFENQFQFNSLRKVIEAQIVSWLNNTTLDTLNDPDEHFIMDEELRTLLTPDCKVIIGRNVENLCYASSQAANRLGICFWADCCHTGSSKEWFFYDGGNKRFKVKFVLRHYVIKSKAKGKVVSYKRKSNGKWKRYKTRLFVQIAGDGRESNCAIEDSFFKSKNPKRRKKRKVKINFWGPYDAVYAQDLDMSCTALVSNQQISGNVQLTW